MFASVETIKKERKKARKKEKRERKKEREKRRSQVHANTGIKEKAATSQTRM